MHQDPWHIASGVYPAVHSSAWWRERGRIRIEHLENASPPNRRKHWTYPWQRVFTSSFANSSITYPARKHPFRFRHESQLRFAGLEQSSEAEGSVRIPADINFINAHLPDMRRRNMGVLPSKKAFFYFLDQFLVQQVFYRNGTNAYFMVLFDNFLFRLFGN